MLRISKKSDYAIFLLTALAQAEGGDAEARSGQDARSAESPSNGSSTARSLRSAAELSRQSGLNRSLVANLLKEFARAGFLESVRGQHGGYRLTRSPASISLRQILQVTEGPISFVDCASHTNPRLLPESGTAIPSDAGLSSSGGGDAGPSQAHSPDCDLVHQCPSRGPLLLVHRRLLALFDSVSLEELARPVRAPIHEFCASQPIPFAKPDADCHNRGF
jgi:hypothetical protein